MGIDHDDFDSPRRLQSGLSHLVRVAVRRDAGIPALVSWVQQARMRQTMIDPEHQLVQLLQQTLSPAARNNRPLIDETIKGA